MTTPIIQQIESQMVPIPAGKIELRDDRTGEIWTETLAPFSMAKFPVTQALYQAVVDENPSTFKQPFLPVETVSWQEATRFCDLLSRELGYEQRYEQAHLAENSLKNGFRLPTEAEWQYACQAGTTGIRYGNLEDIAWYHGNSSGTSHPPGEKLPNAWGLYDMLGNVWEWCEDVYDETVYGTYRIFRGGGWADEPRSVMATTRRRSHPVAFRIEDLGFRVARNL